MNILQTIPRMQSGLLFLFPILFLACNKSNRLQHTAGISKGSSVGNTAIAMPTNNRSSFLRGADVGFLTEMERKGRMFYNATDSQDLFVLLKERGINAIRLRVWVNPAGPYYYNGINDVVLKAVRAKNAGMKLMIDFHYSDSWADPKQQYIPAAWSSYTLSELEDAVAAHTTSCLNTLKANGVTPAYVQVGNEVDYGMLWPAGKIPSGNMAGFARLFKAGYEAVKAVDTTIKVIVHFSRGYDYANCDSVLNGLLANGAVFDVVGLSVYPGLDNFETVLANSNATMQSLAATYHKDIMVAECGYYQYKPEGARRMIETLIQQVDALPESCGLGVFYWEPEAYDHPPVNKSIFDAAAKRPTVGMDGFSLAKNPGFEVDTLPATAPYGWTTGGSNPDANYTESSGITGNYRLTHYKNSAYNVFTEQPITGLTNGTYTFTAWVRGSTSMTGSYLYAKGFGGTEKTQQLNLESAWKKIIIPDIAVSNGQCTIGLRTNGNNTYCSMDQVQFFRQ
ncbi:glycosyl hydrolase 53 family protein [Niabella beijingensis]|uniref:glycosyl hydrolase 53 family protein n=1 Tax=Niabella beijingensis TaxID=2872700 RepID=UPI001CBD375C|nr:glycosyl hydrolase 53 family protein [Niabella beijingensis]MBZ4191415.1 glycosyl hydrolase 53 family protein [Niabella beijingensis]